MKSFLTGLLVALAALSVHVFFFKLYFLHLNRLLIFVITTLNICFLHRGRLQKKSACQTSGTCPSAQDLMATPGLALKTRSMPHGKHMAATWLSHLYLTSLHDKIRSSSSTAWRQWGPLRGQKTAVNGTLTSCCAHLRDQRDLGDPPSKSHDHKERLCHQEPVLDVCHCLTSRNISKTSNVSWQIFSQFFWIFSFV